MKKCGADPQNGYRENCIGCVYKPPSESNEVYIYVLA